MGADTIQVKPEAVSIARRGILMQMQANSNMVETFGSMAQALETLNMWDFVNHQAEVVAAEREWTMFERRTSAAMLERVRGEQA